MAEELVRSRAQVLIHLAALTSVQDCERDPDRTGKLNVDGSLKWLRAAARSRLDHFIFVSSSHVFLPTAEPVWLKPDRAMDSTSVYGKSKAEAELRLAEEARLLGIRLSIARVFSVIAPPGKALRPFYLQAGLQRRARERDFSPLPGHQNVRDFITTDQISQQLMRLVESNQSTGGTYHICSGVPKSVRELAIEEMKVAGIGPSEMNPMFVATDAKPNYLISKPIELNEA